jgi:predicted Zn-dependent protease
MGAQKKFMALGWNKPAILMLCLLGLRVEPAIAQTRSAAANDAEYSRAESLVRNRRWQEGLDALNHLLKADPHNLKALNLAGIASAAKGDTQQADLYFERALRLDSHFLPALKNLSISEFNAHQYAAAEKHLLAAQQQLPDDPTINVYLGEIAYGQQKYSIAAERLNRAGPLVARSPKLTADYAVSLLRSEQKPQALDLLAAINPSTLDAQSQLAVGLALAESDTNQQAIPFLAEAFRHAPDSYNVGYDLALTCFRAKDYATAIATIHELIGRAHDSSELEDLLAESFAASGQTGEASEAYRRAIAFDPSDENNYLDFASFCIDHRGFEDGLKVVALGLREHPNSVRLIFMRGIIEASQDNFDLAEKDFQQAALLNPQHDLGSVGLGNIYLQHGNSAEAIKFTREQLQQKPNDASLLYVLGQGLLASGAQPGQPAFLEAQASLEKSVQLNPKLCLPHVSLGSIYLREERYADAAVQFEAARAIDPTENSAYSHLAVAYRHLGKPEKAKEVLTALQALLHQQRSGTPTQAKANSPADPQ